MFSVLGNQYMYSQIHAHGKLLNKTVTTNLFYGKFPVPLNVRLTKQGQITVKINGMNRILLTANYEPFPIRYVMFGGVVDARSTWYFNCKCTSFDEQDFGVTTPYYSFFKIFFYLDCFIVFTLIIVFVLTNVNRSHAGRNLIFS